MITIVAGLAGISWGILMQLLKEPLRMPQFTIYVFSFAGGWFFGGLI